jgi:predicted phage terminase large subunit-like protein
VLEKVYKGELGNTIINISPGSSKSCLLSRLFPVWAFARNPHSRFLLTSYSDDLVEAHSVAIKDILGSKEFSSLYPGYGFKQDSNKKSEWIHQYNGNNIGEFAALSILGGLTGRRAGYMEEGFTGCIIIDDPIKPVDALSKAKRDAVNNSLYNTIGSRKATSRTPVVMIMQRLHDEDPTGFLVKGDKASWTHISIPALITNDVYEAFPNFIKEIAKEYIKGDLDKYGEASYWEYKEPRTALHLLEENDPATYMAQYQQEPSPEGGVLIQKEWFQTYINLPEKLTNFRITADTAVSAKKTADNSVFILSAESGGNLYILDLIKGRWEMPQLIQNSLDFVTKYKLNFPNTTFRGLYIEYKQSGQGLIQTLRQNTKLPIIDLIPEGDKVLRLQQCLPYIQGKRVYIPENAQWVTEFLDECARFSPTLSHKHDDQVDALVYALIEVYIKTRTAQVQNYYYG